MNVLQKGASRVQYTQKVTLSMWFSFAISAAVKIEVMYTETEIRNVHVNYVREHMWADARRDVH